MNRLRLAGIALVGLAVLYLLLSLPHSGPAQEIQSAIHQGEANAHVQQAQAIPDHAADLAAAKADVAGARAEVARLKRLLAAKPSVPVPDPAGVGPTDVPPVSADHRDSVIAAQDVLIGKLETENGVLKMALTDERARSEQFRLAFEAERKATAALKSRPDSGRWSAGVRIETKFDGTRQFGATARRDLGPAYIEVSGFSDRAGLGFGWRW